MSIDVRTALLKQTLRNAANIEFYRSKWSALDVDKIQTVEELGNLPTTSKDDYRTNFMLDFCDPGDTHYVSHTTGTTGELTWRHRTLNEAAVVRRIFESQQSRSDEDQCVAIQIVNAYHGMPFPIPGKNVVIPVAVSGDIEVEQCLKLLQVKVKVHGGSYYPSILMGEGESVALLTQAIIERGLAEDIHIDSVVLGGFVDRGLKRMIQNAFGASIIHRFSLAEIFGGAIAGDSGDYRTDPYVISEIVDHNGVPQPQGSVGELAMTELYPFVQTQPLIRYLTGDIVERTAEDEFRWWGRRSQCVASDNDGQRRWILGYRQVADILGQQSCVARFQSGPELSIVSAPETGLPAFDLSGSSAGGMTSINIDVALRHNPHLHPEATNQFISQVWSGVNASMRGASAIINIKLNYGTPPRNVGQLGKYAAQMELSSRMSTEGAPSIYD